MNIVHIDRRKVDFFNQLLIDIKASMIEWAEGFIGY